MKKLISTAALALLVLVIIVISYRAITRKLATYSQQANAANAANADLLRANADLARQLAESERRNQETQNRRVLYENAKRDSETVNAIARHYTITLPNRKSLLAFVSVVAMVAIAICAVLLVRARNKPLF